MIFTQTIQDTVCDVSKWEALGVYGFEGKGSASFSAIVDSMQREFMKITLAKS